MVDPPARRSPADDGPPTFTVGQLNRLIRQALELTFPDELWVEGEISSLRRHEASGNVYFQLVDSGGGGRPVDGTVHVTLLKANRSAVNLLLRRQHAERAVRMDDGVHIRIRGSLEYYPPSGKLSLRMTSIDPAHTLGRLAAERDRVLAQLATEGLLARNATLPFPLVPLRVGLVTSAGSAAHADFAEELRASGIGWRITLAAARVQGPGAEAELAASLLALERHGVDVIALVRGGGARTDLMAFDTELLARTIAGLGVPVLTGVGHEIDASVADRVAARSHKTPTACAAALVQQVRDAQDRAQQRWLAIAARAADAIDRHEQALLRTGRHVAFATRARLGADAHRLDEAERRVARRSPELLRAADRHLDLLSARLRAVDPERALARGWSITRTADGRVLRDAADVAPGDELLTTLARGVLRSTALAAPTP